MEVSRHGAGEPDLPFGGDPTSSKEMRIMISQERRKTFRIPVVLEASWDGCGAGWEARITDISTGGCYLDTVVQAAPGELVNIRLRLPEGDLLGVEGLVSYALPHTGFAVSFANLTAEQRHRIERLVELQRPNNQG